MKTASIYIIAAWLCSPATILIAQEAQPATLLGKWSREDLPSSDAYDNTYNEVWGVAINGSEYAIIGSTLGTHFIDVSRPQDAEEVAFVAGASSGSNIIHRDYHHSGCYLYAVSDEGDGSLQIIDMSGLPDTAIVVYDTSTFFTRCHNIFIDTAAALLYACFPRGGESSSYPLKILDISNPVQPRELAAYDNFGSGKVSHVHDCYVENGLAFLNLGFDGFALVDFSDPLNPVFVNTLTDYPFAGYNHSGWPTPDLQYYFLGDETHGYPLKVVDVTDTSDIEVIQTFDADSPADLSIPHNQVVACNFLYVSYYYDGLQVFDVKDPTQPERVLYYSTSSRSHRKSFEGAWGVFPFLPSGNILVSDMQEGLFILSGPEENCAQNQSMSLSCELDIINPVIDRAAAGAGFSVYPQPAKSHLQVRLAEEKGQEKVNARLLDIHGRLVERWEVEALSGSFPLTLTSGAPGGIYFLQLDLAGRRLSKMIVISP